VLGAIPTPCGHRRPAAGVSTSAATTVGQPAPGRSTPGSRQAPCSTINRTAPVWVLR